MILLFRLQENDGQSFGRLASRDHGALQVQNGGVCGGGGQIDGQAASIPWRVSRSLFGDHALLPLLTQSLHPNVGPVHARPVLRVLDEFHQWFQGHLEEGDHQSPEWIVSNSSSQLTTYPAGLPSFFLHIFRMKKSKQAQIESRRNVSTKVEKSGRISLKERMLMRRSKN